MDLHQIGGQHFYYLESCRRQLWLYLHRIDLEEGFESVELGRLIHEESFSRENKEIQIDGLKIDFISKDGYIHETKSSKKVKKEHEAQPLFYAYYLRTVLGFEHIRGARIHYPEIKEVVTLELDEKRVKTIKKQIEEIIKIANTKEIPEVHSNMKLCRKCAYFEFCHI